MEISDVEYVHDGRRYVGRLAVDGGERGRPGVLVCHEGNGLGDHTKDVARRLAELGYVAFALDYYGDGVPLPRDQIAPRLTVLIEDPLRTRSIARAALDVLLAHECVDASRVASIGYCFGGTMSLELARAGTDLRAVVGFHSGLATTRPGDAHDIRAKVLVHIGADDPLVPPDERAAFEAEMHAGGVDWQLHVHGGCVHSFTNPAADDLDNPALRYDAAADRRSWQSMLDLFGEVF